MQKNIKEFFHKEISDEMKGVLNGADISVSCNLDTLIANTGLTQKQFGQKYHIRSATISELMNLKKKNINVVHLAVLMYQLGIYDIRDIFDIQIKKEGN